MNEGRTHLIGLDKPKLNESYTLEKQAAEHEQHRLESIAEALALVGLMNVKKALSGNERVAITGASNDGFQWGEGVASETTVAAHCVPGQILFNAFPFHRMPNWTEDFLKERGLKPLQLDSKLKNVFARTDVVKDVVNKTDNLVERMDTGRGLKPRFASAVRQLLERVSIQRPVAAASLNEILRTAMSSYRLGAAYACEERLDWLKRQLGAASSEAMSKTRNQQIVIAGEYLRVLQDRSWLPDAESLSGLEVIIRDVVVETN